MHRPKQSTRILVLQAVGRPTHNSNPGGFRCSSTYAMIRQFRGMYAESFSWPSGSKPPIAPTPTPPWATRGFMEYVIEDQGPFASMSCPEPACGAGHMAKVAVDIELNAGSPRRGFSGTHIRSLQPCAPFWPGAD
jgi:hypothetical protein